jgi:hypothetical protein
MELKDYAKLITVYNRFRCETAYEALQEGDEYEDYETIKEDNTVLRKFVGKEFDVKNNPYTSREAFGMYGSQLLPYSVLDVQFQLESPDPWMEHVSFSGHISMAVSIWGFLRAIDHILQGRFRLVKVEESESRLRTEIPSVTVVIEPSESEEYEDEESRGSED